jgi:Family of unknown function (DUF6152)
MNRRLASLAMLAGAAAAILGLPALAHHSFAMFNQREIVTLEGTVVEFQWTNPHAFIELSVQGRGGAQRWAIELNSPNNLRRQGWTRTSLRSGDRITLRMNPLRDGRHGGLFLDARKADGTYLDSGLPKNGAPINVPQL